MHQVHGCKLPQDLVLSLRSIAAETTQAGYHFYILYQASSLPSTFYGWLWSTSLVVLMPTAMFACAKIHGCWMVVGDRLACRCSTDSSTPLQPPTRDFYMLEEVKETRLTREEVMECLPLDLHHFVIIHDFEEDFAFYPALSKDDENVYPKDLWASHAGLSVLFGCCGARGSLLLRMEESRPASSDQSLLTKLRCVQGPGPRAAFVSMSRFMQRYQAYEYAWIVEYDARCALPAILKSGQSFRPEAFSVQLIAWACNILLSTGEPGGI